MQYCFVRCSLLTTERPAQRALGSPVCSQGAIRASDTRSPIVQYSTIVNGPLVFPTQLIGVACSSCLTLACRDRILHPPSLCLPCVCSSPLFISDLQGRCVICGGLGISDAYYCKECTQLEKDRDGCPKIINLGSAKTDLFYERKSMGSNRGSGRRLWACFFLCLAMHVLYQVAA